jgi:hypothetical protein
MKVKFQADFRLKFFQSETKNPPSIRSAHLKPKIKTIPGQFFDRDQADQAFISVKNTGLNIGLLGRSAAKALR